MASRGARGKKKGDPKMILMELIKIPENMVCADCRSKGPRWASSTLGVFICIRCSGLHRNLGTHLSFVRSVNLDEWRPDQVQMMVTWGNKNAAAYFEHNVPVGYPIPDEHSSVQHVTRWIRDKYEYCKFAPRGDPEGDPRRGGVPKQSVSSSGEGEAAPAREAPREQPRPLPKPPKVAATPAAVPPRTRQANVKPVVLKPRPVVAKPVAAQPVAVQPAPAPPPPPPDLLDFSAPETEPSPAAQQPASEAVVFDAFVGGGAPAAQTTQPAQPQTTGPPGASSSSSGLMSAAMPPQQQQTSSSKISSDAILAMYAGGPAGFALPAPTLSPQRAQPVQPHGMGAQPAFFGPGGNVAPINGYAGAAFPQQQQQQQQQMAMGMSAPNAMMFPGGQQPQMGGFGQPQQMAMQQQMYGGYASTPQQRPW